jgi:tetratricopeptide (TPR) repeat protein
MGTMAALLEAHLEGDSELGIEAVRRAGELASSALVCYLTGALHMRLGQWDDSERQLRRAIELDPSFQPPHDLLSRVMAARGQTAEAVQSALQALEIDYGSAFSHYVLGLAFIAGGEEQRALRAFDQSRALNPQLLEARLWSAAIRLHEAAATR